LLLPAPARVPRLRWLPGWPAGVPGGHRGRRPDAPRAHRRLRELGRALGAVAAQRRAAPARAEAALQEARRACCRGGVGSPRGLIDQPNAKLVDIIQALRSPRSQRLALYMAPGPASLHRPELPLQASPWPFPS